MAAGKKSFLLYTDSIHTVNMLSDEQAGKLFKTIFKFVNDEEIDLTSDMLLAVAFEPIKQYLKRDLKAWEAAQEQRRQAGKKSAEARKKAKELKQQESTTVNERKRKRTVNVSGNGNGTGSVKPKESIEDRARKFKAQIAGFAHLFNNDAKELTKFYEYWTEKNPNGRKMRFEKEKTYDLKKRLDTWFSNSKEWGNKQPKQKAEKKTAAKALQDKIKGQ